MKERDNRANIYFVGIKGKTEFNKNHSFKIFQWHGSVNTVETGGHLKKEPSVLIVLIYFLWGDNI